MANPIRVLVVEDSELDARTIERKLSGQAQPYDFTWATRLEDGLARVEQADVALIDLQLPDSSGIDTLKRLLRGDPGIPVVVLSSEDNAELARQCVEAGAQDYVTKAAMTGDSLARAIAESLYKSAKRQLAHSDRLASIGQLAAGVAHEVNNPAAFVETNTSLLMGDVSELTQVLFDLRAQITSAVGDEAGAFLDAYFLDHEVSATLARMGEICSDNLDGIKRIGATVKELSAFARIDKNDVEVANLVDVIRIACNMVRNQIRHRGQLIIDTKPLPLVAIHRARLIQVFVNLLVNASHALDESTPEDNFIRVRAWTDDGNLRITVEDNGCGIPEADMARLFEPFFTTKPRDRGTGLGLALAAETIRSHGGELTVESQVGHGTTFSVVMPAITGLTPTPSITRGKRASALTRKPCRVLVVDDEALLRRAYERVLAPPHAVVHAADGNEALAILTRDRGFDVILCDLMMPGLDGPGFYDGVDELDSVMCSRIAFVSGGAFTDRCVDFLSRVEPVVLEKPISSEVLLAIVDRIAHETS